MRARRKSLLAPLAVGLVGALSFGLTAPAGAQEGDANGLRAVVSVLGGVIQVPNTPHSEQPPGGSTTVLGLPGSVAPAATAAVLTATTSSAGSSASVANARVLNSVVPGFASVLTADAISSQCSGSTGSASLLNANAAGIPLNAAPPPNTVVPVPGVGSVTLNEQTTGPDGSITVRAVHLSVNVLGIVVADVVLSESACLAAIEAQVAGATAVAGTGTGAGGVNLTG